MQGGQREGCDRRLQQDRSSSGSPGSSEVQSVQSSHDHGDKIIALCDQWINHCRSLAWSVYPFTIRVAIYLLKRQRSARSGAGLQRAYRFMLARATELAAEGERGRDLRSKSAFPQHPPLSCSESRV